MVPKVLKKEIDPNSWTTCHAFVSPGVALLPFVDERRLRAALEEVYPDLTPEESKNPTSTWSTLSLCNRDFTFPYTIRPFFSFVKFPIKGGINH